MWKCFFQYRTKNKPNQTIPNWTKPNQNISDCLILVSCWCIQNFRSLGYLKVGFLNVAPGGWVRAAAGAGGEKISRKNIPLRGPTCMLEPCKISSRAEIPSWARVWQQPNKIKSTKPNQNTRDCLIFMSYWHVQNFRSLGYVKVRFFSIAPIPNQTIPNWTKPNQNTWDCLILVSFWCIQNFRSLGYLKIGFLNVAPGGWVRAAAGAGGKKISRINQPLRGPTCKLEPARSKQSWIPSWARVWQ